MPKITSLSERFKACTVAPVCQDVDPTSPLTINPSGECTTTSFYLDSSGRSSFILPLQIGCPTKEDADLIVQSGCLRPYQMRFETGEDDSDEKEPSNYLLRFEVKCQPKTGSEIVSVESIKVLSCSAQGNSFFFDLEVVVRSLSSVSSGARTAPFPVKSDEQTSNSQTVLTRSRLEVTPILTQKYNTVRQRHSASGLSSLDLGPGHVAPSFASDKRTKMKPLLLTLSLTQALAISVRNVPGSSQGNTLVSLTMAHSNTHTESITVTNIVVHPGHSRQEVALLNSRSMPGGEHFVTDMSKYVQWGYAPRTEPKLPLTLQQNDAYSTVITIDAGEDLRSRTFASPISVTAVVGKVDATDDEQVANKQRSPPTVVVSTDALWTTGRVAVVPADAFRIDMSLEQSSCFVGAPLVVTLRVLNLSPETRDLMLLMAKDDDKTPNQRTGTVNTAVVSEVNGYTFGVWGLSGDDDGTTRYNRDHDLLAVDAALLLGEVKGQHSVDAKLRFVPLREGTLDVPNLKLYDKTMGKWYDCTHNLRVVAATRKS